MVRPEDYVPPDAPRYRPPTRWQRARDPLLVTAIVSAGCTVWALCAGPGGTGVQVGFYLGSLLVIGLLSALRPAWGFEFGGRWQFRDSPQPSDSYLVVTRVFGAVTTGVVLVVTAVLLS